MRRRPGRRVKLIPAQHWFSGRTSPASLSWILLHLLLLSRGTWLSIMYLLSWCYGPDSMNFLLWHYWLKFRKERSTGWKWVKFQVFLVIVLGSVLQNIKILETVQHFLGLNIKIEHDMGVILCWELHRRGQFWCLPFRAHARKNRRGHFSLFYLVLYVGWTRFSLVLDSLSVSRLSWGPMWFTIGPRAFIVWWGNVINGCIKISWG